MRAHLLPARVCPALGLTALLAGCAHGAGREATPEIFVLMGQSNMSGRGVLAEAPADYTTPDARIMLYGNDGVWKPAVEPVDSAAGQIDQVSGDPTIAAVGPALAFAKALIAAKPSRRIILVPCAKGGSAIDQWAPATERTTLYGSCLARVKAAAPRGRLAGLLWYQGETDAENEARAVSWSAKFVRVVESFRADVGAPGLRTLVVGLADPPMSGTYAARYTHWNVVQQAQRTLPLSNHVHVSATGLPKNPDQLHLSAAGEIELGRRMARVW